MTWPETLGIAQRLRLSDPVELTAENAGVFSCREERTGLIPVLICAKDEANDLPATLASLAMSEGPIHPFVIDNGSSDGTTDIAKEFGATTLTEPQPGKNNAFQTGLKHVLDRGLGPFVLSIDADVIVGPKWASSMVDSLGSIPKLGGLSYGLWSIQDGESTAIDMLRTVILNSRQMVAKMAGFPAGSRGGNMGINLSPGKKMTTALLQNHKSAPVTPDDKQQKLAVLAAGGVVIPNLGPLSLAVTKGDRYSTAREYLASVAGRIARPNSLSSAYTDAA